MPALKSYTLPLSYGSAGGTEPSEAENASASLLWVDRPFAVTAAGQFTEFLERGDVSVHREEPVGHDVPAGGQLFGFFGILLALPVAAVLSVLVRFAYDRYLKEHPEARVQLDLE